MQNWDNFKHVIHMWAICQIEDEQFYLYLTSNEFAPADQRVADIFIKQHDNGEWSHAIYHRMR